MDYVNIMQAAHLCRVSDKTIRRWIHAQKLPARFPSPNRCEIALGDLEPFFPGQVSGQNEGTLENRIVALEGQVQRLEHHVQQPLASSLPSRAPMPRKRARRESMGGSLPRHLVSVLAFAHVHGIAEQKVQTHIAISLLPVHRGAWTDPDQREISLALDAKGCQAFYQLYHEIPWFVACPHCPHGLPGHV